MHPRLRRLAQTAPLEPLARRLAPLYRSAVPRKLSALERKAQQYDAMTVEVARRCLSGSGTCVDAGANRGDLLGEFIRVSPTSTFLAFEPIPVLARSLARRYPVADVRAVALSAQPGSAEFRYLPDRPALSSLLVRPERETGLAVRQIQVPLEPLDQAVSGKPTVEFVKVDVEGAELDVLRGAARVLTEDRPVVVFECGGTDNLLAIWEELARRDYQLWTMPDWLADQPSLADGAGLLSAAGAGEFQFVAGP